MKAKVYIAPTQYAYRAAEDGQSIQFLDTTLNLGWKHSDYMTDKVLKAARPAQEVLDEEAARRGWQLWEEPEGQAAGAQDNAVQLAAILADRYKRSGGEMTAEGFKKFLGTGGYGDPDLGDIEYDYKGVSIRPEPQRWTREMKFTWAKFIKFCRENGLIEEESIKCNTKFAQKPAAAANMAIPAAPPQAKTSTTSESTEAESSSLEPPPSSGTAIMSAPASPADAGAAAQSLSAAAPASSEIRPLDSLAFDYTGLDQPTVDTLHLAERMIRDARRDYITKLAQAVYIVHDALCGGVVAICDNSKHGHRGEDTFRAWCTSVGLGKDTAYRLLQVAALLNGSTPEEQAVLEAASPSLLYAAAKPSAPAELVQAVKDGDITTHKEYQALLAQLKAKDQELAAERADREAERASTSALLADEQQRRQEAEQARIAAEKSAQGAKESYRVAQKNEMLQIQRAKDAENQRAMMEEREQIHLARIAELEARPVEVVGADPDEIERRANALAAEKTATLKAELEMERSISEDLAGKLAEANMSLEDSQQENTDSLLLAGVRRTISLCSMLLAEEFERLARVDSDLCDLAADHIEAFYMDLGCALANGRWPDEKDGEED